MMLWFITVMTGISLCCPWKKFDMDLCSYICDLISLIDTAWLLWFLLIDCLIDRLVDCLINCLIDRLFIDRCFSLLSYPWLDRSIERIDYVTYSVLASFV